MSGAGHWDFKGWAQTSPDDDPWISSMCRVGNYAYMCPGYGNTDFSILKVDLTTFAVVATVVVTNPAFANNGWNSICSDGTYLYLYGYVTFARVSLDFSSVITMRLDDALFGFHYTNPPGTMPQIYIEADNGAPICVLGEWVYLPNFWYPAFGSGYQYIPPMVRVKTDLSVVQQIPGETLRPYYNSTVWTCGCWTDGAKIFFGTVMYSYLGTSNDAFGIIVVEPSTFGTTTSTQFIRLDHLNDEIWDYYASMVSDATFHYVGNYGGSGRLTGGITVYRIRKTDYADIELRKTVSPSVDYGASGYPVSESNDAVLQNGWLHYSDYDANGCLLAIKAQHIPFDEAPYVYIDLYSELPDEILASAPSWNVPDTGPGFFGDGTYVYTLSWEEGIIAKYQLMPDDVAPTQLYDFTWVDDMFYEEPFPYNISFNSVAATRYEDDVVVVDSGISQRINRWKHPLMEFDVAWGVRTLEDLHKLIGFFRTVNGREVGFLYLDFLDFTSTTPVNFDTRVFPPITSNDQVLGTGNGTTTIFQLQKKYYIGDGTHFTMRPIFKPIRANTIISCAPGGNSLRMTCPGVLVSIGGTTQPAGSFTVDFALGKVVFNSPPPAGGIVRAGYWFYVPSRFDTRRLPVNLENYGMGSASEVKLTELRLSETI